MPARCLNCFYILDGLPAARCPECGQVFDPNDPRTYTTKPPFIWWRYWLPAFLLAAIPGLIAYMVLLPMVGYGWAAWFVVPFCLGAVIGYATRVRTISTILLVLLAMGTVVGGLMTVHLAGLLCGLVLGGVALGPALIGMLCGKVLRSRLKVGRFSQRQWLPLLFLWLVPFIWGRIEGRHVYPNETIETSLIIPTSVAAAWDGVMFYEEVEHEPPLLLRLLLPRPLYISGGTQNVGDIKYCVYSKGRLVKKITKRDERQLLAFDVIEQHNIENRSVRLTGGEFRFEIIGVAQTRVTLATSYQPLLGPRLPWRWAEKLATHSLHHHVLQGMMLKAKALSVNQGKETMTFNND
jgi:hypothetical protein